VAYALGITLRPWTVGGTTTTEAGEALFTRAKVTASRSLMLWGATGWRYESATRTITSTEGAQVSGELPVCDQSGWRTEGGAIIDVSVPNSYTHTYTIKVSQFRKDSAGREIPVGEERTYANVFIPTGDLSPFDLDAMLPVSTQAGGVVLVPGTWDARVAAAEAVIAAITPAGQAITQADDARAQRAALSAPSILRARLMAASEAAFRHDTPAVMASPPTIATGLAALDATLTRVYTVTGNPDAFTTYGGVPTIVSTNFWVFPVVTTSTGNGNVGGGKTANGFAVEFVTDADKVEVRMLKGTSSRGLMIEVDGQRIQAAPIAYPVEAGSTLYVLLTFPDSRPRRIRAEGAEYGGLRAVAVHPTRLIWPAAASNADKLTMAVVGDSLTAQIGATLPNGGWAATAGKLLGIRDVWMVAHPGTGFTTAGASDGTTYGDARRIADVVASNPDLVILNATGNDPSGTVRAPALAAMQAYRAALPGVPIIVGGIWPGSGGPSAERVAVEAEVKAAFDLWADPLSWWVAAAAPASWITGTGKSTAPVGDGNADVYVGSDGVHPTQAGHDYYGLRWAGAIRSIINGAGL